MHEGYSSPFVCVCVSVYVCYHASCYIRHLYSENQMLLSFLRRVDFAETTRALRAHPSHVPCIYIIDDLCPQVQGRPASHVHEQKTQCYA